MPVLICYDGSTSAQRALSVAASALDGAPMVLLNIWNPPQRVMADSFGVSESEHGPTLQELEALSCRRAADILAEGEAEAQHGTSPGHDTPELNGSSIGKPTLDVPRRSVPRRRAGTGGTTAVESRAAGQTVSNALGPSRLHRPARPRPPAAEGRRGGPRRGRRP